MDVQRQSLALWSCPKAHTLKEMMLRSGTKLSATMRGSTTLVLISATSAGIYDYTQDVAEDEGWD